MTEIHSIKPPFLRVSVYLLVLVLGLTACSSPDPHDPPDPDVAQESTPSEAAPDDDVAVAESDVIEPLEAFYPQTLRYFALDWHFKAATVQRSEGWTLSGYPRVTNTLRVEVDIENRITRTTNLSSSGIDCDLLLSDGRSTEAEWYQPQLTFHETESTTLSFEMEGDVDFRGAQLMCWRTSRDSYVPHYIPLDAPYAGPKAASMDDLVGRVFETQDETQSTQWKFEIVSTRYALDSDENDGERAEWGMRLIELQMKAHLLEGNAGGSNLRGNQFRLSAGGYTVHGEMRDHDLLYDNQMREAGIVFQVPEDTTEFELLVDTEDAERQSVLVDLARVTPLREEEAGAP
jgi:hypothetical protein